MATPNSSPHLHGRTEEIRSDRGDSPVRSLAGAAPKGGGASSPVLMGNYDRMFKLRAAKFGSRGHGIQAPGQVQQLLARLAGTMFQEQPESTSAQNTMTASATALAHAAASGVGISESLGATATPARAVPVSGPPAPIKKRAESTIPAGYT